MTQEQLATTITEWFLAQKHGYAEHDDDDWCVTIDGHYRLDKLAEHILKELEIGGQK